MTDHTTVTDTIEARREHLKKVNIGFDPYDSRVLLLEVCEGLLRVEAAVAALHTAAAVTPRKAKKGA